MAKSVRFDENGVPSLIITHQIRKFCHQELAEQTKDGDVVEIKLHASHPFLEAFNKMVYERLLDAIDQCRKDGRTRLTAEDV